MLKALSMVFIALIALAGTSCSGSSSFAPSQRPVLYNLAVSLGDFDFESLKADHRNPYIAFGAPFRDEFLNATFEYYPNAESEIVSPVNGVVIELEYKPSPGDYSISLEATNANEWKVIIDHVQGPTIALGDTVTAGQKIGIAGVWEKSFGRTELQIFNNNDNLSYCPTAFLSPDIASEVIESLTLFMTSWMDYIEDQSVYDTDKMNPAGCLAETVQG